jgi:serine/threonine protein kinase
MAIRKARSDCLGKRWWSNKLEYYFEEQGQFYLVQEYIAGETLTGKMGYKPPPSRGTFDL